MKHVTTHRDGDERGSTTLELVIVVPGFILLLLLLVFGFRATTAGQNVEAAAGAAARDAALARSAGLAQANGASAASAAINQAQAPCQSTRASIDTSGFNAPLGQIGTVRATVSCVVPLYGLLPMLPGTMTITKTASQPVDAYTQRQP
ncbi:TadE/TadG family type IV pilus assembly protein [Sinomonas sp. JGH33]|uniref:TadE/TadG family type IV pilus assembly protein n=1 Tax=Sinomonas terricola TaxID=3110330 RepID=A0ABU5TCB6_9MICC|nr:TadE/TadG family type IV pilus assembly protein [Sinomonas sp. JGH33]MEA5457300.1 TadE/TadG family type IV pilus assembly protein [Sinomonas sp. JGH33]